MVVTAMAAVVAAQAPADEEPGEEARAGLTAVRTRSRLPHPLDGAVVVLDADDLDPDVVDVPRGPERSGDMAHVGWLAVTRY